MCEWGKEQKIVDLPDWVIPEKKTRTISVDKCIVSQLLTLWEEGVHTLACCCGHQDVSLFGGTPSVVVANGLSNKDIDKVKELLKNIDNRSWRIYQWRITEV